MTIVHLAVGWGVPQLKVGSFARSERMAKWNEALGLLCAVHEMTMTGDIFRSRIATRGVVVVDLETGGTVWPKLRPSNWRRASIGRRPSPPATNRLWSDVRSADGPG